MRLNVSDLVGEPGASRPVHEVVARGDFGAEPWGAVDDLLDDRVVLDLHLDSVVEGILVRGTVGTSLTLACARCLAPCPTEVEAEVSELFVDPVRSVEEVEPGYEIVDDLTGIDVSTMVRDAVLIDLPVRVVCRDDCAGLCPTCGVDRNVESCGHAETDHVDPRWSALLDLTRDETRPSE